MAYGSPDRIDDVPAYYADIRGGRPIRPELLADLTERYRRVGIAEDSKAGPDGVDSAGPVPRDTREARRRNPLNEITEQVRASLQVELAVPVFTGMKHWRPRIADAAEAAVGGGAETIVGLVLAPHYSRLSIGGYREQLDEAVAGRADVLFVESWHSEPGFVELLADRVRGTAAHVVFTAHSLPARILEEGDPYAVQLLETSELVAKSAGLRDFTFSYQSESQTGEPWLQPDILDHLETLRAEGVDDVLVCPIGFVADHLEIRWDIDTAAQEKAAELGMRLARIEMPNAEPRFVGTLAAIVRRVLAVPSNA
jgi:protoporphyrin/coproporphyrin ferrochelatase